MDSGILTLQGVVAIGALAALLKTRHDRRRSWLVACAAVALLVQSAWLLLELLGVSIVVIARLTAPLAIAIPLLLIAGKVGEFRSGRS